MASGEGQSNPSTSGDADRDHHEDFGNEYGPLLPTQEELREMEHRRLVGEATNLMLNFAKDPKLAKYMSETAFQDVQAQLKATTTSPPKPNSKKQYSEKELEAEIDARLAWILGAQKQGKKHGRKQKKSTNFNGYLGSQSTFDKAKKHKKYATVPSSSSSSESSSESSEEESSKKRSRRHRHGKGKRKSRSRRADDNSTADSSTDSSDSEDGHFYANKNFYKANQYDFLEDKSKKATELEVEAYPVLDELTSKISTLNLERVRRLKSRLVALTRRVQKVRDEIEQLMDDDGDMAEMYLTEKQERLDNFFSKDQAATVFAGLGVGGSISAPVSPVCSPPESQRRLEKNLSMAASRHSSSRVSEEESDIQELEMLLEAYFVVIDAILNKLTSLKEYIDDTEDFINIELDNVRNQLIQFELLLTVSTFVVAIFGVVAGVFGMNIPIAIFDEPKAFKWVLIIAGIVGFLIFGSFIWYFRRRGLMTL
ncbi:hypothetical protein L7F22_051620 [Adiantum nelumboides]|nr:hypothetical protein [Adiantum nelumboides]